MVAVQQWRRRQRGGCRQCGGNAVVAATGNAKVALAARWRRQLRGRQCGISVAVRGVEVRQQRCGGGGGGSAAAARRRRPVGCDVDIDRRQGGRQGR